MNLRRQPTLSQLTRLTLATEDPSAASQAFTGTHPAAASYDLLAVQPLSERVLQQACTSLEVDIITFDLAKRLPFRLKSGPLQAAIKRGIFFEILYAPALREETARRNVFTNALALTRATRGKGVIISSGARSAFELRGPYDVINLATLFGLSEQDAKAAVSRNCDAVLAHAKARKAYKGAVILETEIDTAQAQAGTNAMGVELAGGDMSGEVADKQGQSSEAAQPTNSKLKTQPQGLQNAGNSKHRKRKSR